MPDALRPVDLVRVGPSGRATASDQVAVEEPLEVRLNGEPFAVVMRTPGADHPLAAGFLLAEEVIRGPEHIGSIKYCEDPDDPDFRNVLDVTVVGIDVADRLRERRRITMTSACGLCGRTTIESLRSVGQSIDAEWSVPASVVSMLPERLRDVQAGFEATGGLHAAGLFDHKGTLDGFAEDIGRHNAVDKVIGRAVLDGATSLADRILVVSGRAGFELVQKALKAAIPVMVSVGAASSLAVDMATAAGMALFSFVGPGRGNLHV